MMRRLFKFDQYTDRIKYQQAVYTTNLLLFVGVIYAVYMLFFPNQVDGSPLFQLYLQTGDTLGLVVMASFYGVTFVALYLVRAGSLQSGAWLALIASGILSIGSSYDSGLISKLSTIIILFPIIVGALLLGRNGLMAGLGITLFGYALIIVIRPYTLPTDYQLDYQSIIAQTWIDIGELAIAVTVFFILMWFFLRNINTGLEISINEAVEMRAKIGDIVTELTQRVAKRMTIADLANYTIERILVDFPNIYHAQIFLVSEDGVEARLFASTGEVGKRLIQRAHALRVGSVSVIGQVTYLGKYIVAKAGSQDTVHQRNELLPDTQVEAAFPLRIGDKVIGALDLQSKERDAFDREDLAQAFQTLADSIGLAIDNIRQYDRAEERIRENQRLAEEAREALRQLERLNQRMTGRAWSDYIQGAGYDIGASVDFVTRQVATQAELTPSLKEAIDVQQFVQTTTPDGRQIITVPLRVRGRVIGAMEFELDANDEFTPDDFDLLNEVSDRFGVAIENVRLVDESQRTAQREALVNQIVGRLQTINTLEDMVVVAAKGLHDAIKANKIAIKLGTPPR